MGVLYIKTENGVEAINKASVDLSGYATQEYVKNKIAEAELGGEEVDLSGYAQKSELPTKVSQLENDKGYLTAVPAGYAKTEDIPTKPSDIGAQPAGNYLTEVPAGYAKTEDIPTTPADIGAQPAGNYALKSEIPSVPVKSVNGKTGAVSLSASDVGAMPSGTKIPSKTSDLTNDSGYITDYTESDPTVPAWAKASTKPSYSKSEVGLSNVDNVKQYSASNPPPYPVTSVNGKTGAVSLDAAAVGARPSTWTPSASDVGALPASTTIPTKVSQLANDKGYLTQHQDISGKVDKDKLALGRDENGLLYLYIDGVPVGAGVELPSGGIDGYITADKQIVFNNLPDGDYTLAYINDDGSVVPIGSMVKDTNVYYTVTNTLTQCTNSNSATKVVQGSAYSATITAKSGYELKSVTATMGGTAVSVSNGKINIASVTGNIVITAVAEEIKATYTNLFDPSKATINSRLNSSAAVTSHDGYVITNFFDVNGKTPLTNDTKIYMKGATINDDGKARIFTYKTNGTDYTNSFSYVNKNSVTINDEGNGVISVSGLAAAFASGVVRAVMCLKVKDTALTTADLNNIVITIDEPIA